MDIDENTLKLEDIENIKKTTTTYYYVTSLKSIIVLFILYSYTRFYFINNTCSSMMHKIIQIQVKKVISYKHQTSE